ncbi:Conserved_hypothetical protein [Hexamita inflata]|uniref:C2HC/C3H-type domain-containing protein n=1 Tax=Hexamita inflata TaxID=28002 RepID=A0AA86U3J3_9EUKA|nr:Conserved hypothetical protein [Hexamita inflata]
MSDIACPFCAVRYPSSELILHCQQCKQKQKQNQEKQKKLKQQVEKVTKQPVEEEEAGYIPKVVKNPMQQYYTKQPIVTKQEEIVEVEVKQKPVKPVFKSKQEVSFKEEEVKVQSQIKQQALKQQQQQFIEQEETIESKEQIKQSKSETQSEYQPKDGEFEDEEKEKVQCEYCGRYLNFDRIQKHEIVCKKSTNKKVKVFNADAQRLQTLQAEAAQLVQVVKAPRTNIDRTAKVKATKLMWEEDTTGNFGDKPVNNFKPVYEQDQDKPDQVQSKNETPKEESKKEKKVEIVSQKTEIEIKDEIGGPRLNRTPVAKDTKDFTEDTTVLSTTKEQEKSKKHRKSSKTSSKDDQKEELEQLKQMLAIMAKQQQPQAPQQPQVQAPVQQMPQYYQQMPYEPYRPQYDPRQYQRSLPPPEYAQPQRARFCIYCGVMYQEQAIFCGNCGAKRVD